MNFEGEQKFLIGLCTPCLNLFTFFDEELMQFVKIEKINGFVNFHDT